jgi:hypothetical protein
MEKSMKMLAAAGLFVGLAGLAGSALAEDAPAPPKEKKVCRSEAVTGSIMARSTCHTKTEWEQIDSANARSARQMLDRPQPATGQH